MEMLPYFSWSHLLWRWFLNFRDRISGDGTKNGLASPRRWCSCFQGIISGDGYMVFKPASPTPLQRWCSCFQSIISGDGYMVFKPSSPTPLQRWCICFQSIISGDGYMVFKSSSPTTLHSLCIVYGFVCTDLARTETTKSVNSFWSQFSSSFRYHSSPELKYFERGA